MGASLEAVSLVVVIYVKGPDVLSSRSDVLAAISEIETGSQRTALDRSRLAYLREILTATSDDGGFR